MAAVCVPPQSSVEKSSTLHDANFVAVLFAEKRHGLVFVDGDIDGHVFDDFDAIVAQDFAVGEVFDVLQFFVGQRGEVREVEAQVRGMNREPACLTCVPSTSRRAACSRCVPVWLRLCWRGARRRRRHRRVADRDVLLEDGLVRADALHGQNAAATSAMRGVVVGRGEPADVADLSAGVGVEGRVVEHNFALFAGLR